MKSMLVCVSLVLLAQGWERPVIKESELAAPPGAGQGSPAVGDDTARPGQTGSWDMDSGNADAEQRDASPQAEQEEVVTRWEYDDEGRPVVRTVGTAETSHREPEKEVESRNETAREQREPGRIATFWFVLPRR